MSHQAAIDLGIARVSTSSHVPRHPVNARALRRGVAQLWDPPVDGFRHAAQLISVGLALLAEAPIGEPLVEGLRLVYRYVCSIWTTASSFSQHTTASTDSKQPQVPPCYIELPWSQSQG